HVPPTAHHSIPTRRPSDLAASDRVTANGTVAVGGTLILNTTQSFSVGTAITLIDNDGADAVTGTFTNLPQSASFFVGSQLFAIRDRKSTRLNSSHLVISYA